jgi:hypothetical protein
MADQEAQEDARRAAEALLLRAEQRLSSPTAASTSSTGNSSTPTAAAAAAQASIKSALTKAQGSIKSAQEKMSASIETMERAAVEKIEGITSPSAAAAAEKTKTNANANASAAEEDGATSATATTSAGSTADTAVSMKAALDRAQGSIRSFQEKVSTSLDAVKAQTQEKVSASLSVVKHIDSSTPEVDGKAEAGDTGIGSSGGETIERLKSESTAIVQEASKSMKSAFRMAQGKVTASMQGLKLESVLHSAGATSAPSQEDIEAKIFSDLDRVSEQIELCKSMMSQSSDGGGENSSESSEGSSNALLIVVGYLEASTTRFASLINAGTAGEISEEALERVLSVHHELRRTLDDYSKTAPSDSTTKEEDTTTAGNEFSGEGCLSEENTAASAPPSDSNAISDYSGGDATVAETSNNGGGSPVESDTPAGMELGKTTDL